MKTTHPSGVEIGSLFSQRTKEGHVEIAINGERTQMDLDKAREVLGMLSGAIEAAISDQLLYTFLVQRVGVSEEKAFWYVARRGARRGL
jgi:hypothetical protein